MQWTTTVILARLLAPSDFGLIGMAMVVIGFMEVFRDLGTSAAVIQRQELNDSILSSLFWVNVGFALLCALVVYLLSPLVAMFYKETRLTPILLGLSLCLLFSGAGVLHNALLQRNLAFKVLARIELTSAFIGAGIAMGLALYGAGVWALIFQSLFTSLASTILLWSSSSWRPSFIFSWSEMRSVSSYSLNLTGYRVFNYLARNADYLIIGRYLGARDLGFYTLAYQIMLYPVRNVTAVISRVLFPLFSKIQDDNFRFRNAYLKICFAIALIVFPMMAGVWVVSKYLILAVFGQKWEPVILLLLILSPLGMIQAIGATVGPIYQAKGRTDWIFLWGIGSGIFVTMAFVIGVQWGVVGVAVAYTIVGTILFYPNFIIPFRLIELKFRELIKVLSRPFFCTLLMVSLLLATKFFLPDSLNHIWSLGILVILGILIYGAASWWLNRDQLLEVVEVLKS
jgi:PST family polysaccharide transporter